MEAYEEMANGDTKKDSGHSNEAGKNDTPNTPQLRDDGKGVGRVARYIEEFGGLRRGLRRDEAAGDSKTPSGPESAELQRACDDFRVDRFIQDFPTKYPQSCVVYVHYRNTDVKAMFSYLRQKEWVLQKELVGCHESRRLEVLAALEATENTLIWMTANLRNHG